MSFPDASPHEEISRLLRVGDLNMALESAASLVRGSPDDAALRIGLFQLLAASGQWQRAGDQLQLAGRFDAAWLPLVKAYARVVSAEHARAQVLAGQMLPLMLGQVPRWLHDLLQALQHDQRGETVQAVQRRQLALTQAEAVAGAIDGQRFDWLGDADPRFGPCLEVVLEAGYAWVALSQLRRLRFEAPSALRDLLWQQVELTWTDGVVAHGVVPCRYPGSELRDEPQLRLARQTRWEGDGAAARGVGQRMLASSLGEHALLDVRLIEFDVSAQGQASWPN
ncbi:type VI secretion system accessory protein TagJ [Xanthomonas translucens]|uniref:type VI secretion system accessory protein TagJ n=1 Tax=Xanthomonas campestris pv. translucens TaxID=343 RepID=UPI0002A7B559|nr:type VI secretion system accessory protein TagJ [Xanthomonas translucens]AVY67443.1 ImpE protein [Xanthomonas translucens pv. undulosa]ELQ12953.1 ImpE protein [Xanthomonas translucens DAR61454]MBC3973019.1 ImpE protein [Xanthomonas translucens pv. undulosa]MCT8270413.1 ImpE protein [Xanthomonas translucens pv. undulosa]MCT8280824.1 ImpE protein [Xanthomonas translucens pv. undulosa]